MLAALFRQLNARLQVLRYRSNLDEAKWRRAALEHEEMLEALAARDAPRLPRAMRRACASCCCRAG